MEKRRVVITGLGVIGPNGIGKQAFIDAVLEGVLGIKPISLFDTSYLNAKLAGEIKNFSPEEILGPKGLRTLDRSTKLVSCATKLALDDAGLTITDENSSSVGVAIGTTLGSISSIMDFDKDAIIEGPRYVNPALFPNTVINSPASQVSIRFNLKGFNTTISTGFTASLDAINYAVDFIRLGRAKFVLAGGVEELCLQLFLGFYKAGCLAGNDGHPEVSCPFDKRRNGIVLGEGAAVLLLEDLDSARERKAKIYAEVLGFGRSFEGFSRAMRLALEQANLKVDEIDYISAAANSTQNGDFLETQGIKEVFADYARRVYVSSLKSALGETYSASGSFQTIAAVGAIEKQMAPALINYQEQDPACDLNYVVNQAKETKIENVLINASGPNSGYSSLIISKFKG